jgi:hypothetical protein
MHPDLDVAEVILSTHNPRPRKMAAKPLTEQEAQNMLSRILGIAFRRYGHMILRL